MKIISKIAKTLLVVIVIVMIVLSLGFVWLKQGINIGNFSYQNFMIEQLYIKFDNKIVVSAKDIKIPLNLGSNSTSQESTGEEIQKITKYFPYLNKYFKEVNIQNISLGENNATILYKNDIFYIDNAFVKVDVRLTAKEKSFDILVNELSLKDFNLVITGNANANFKDNFYKFLGNFKTHEIDGQLDFSVENGILKYNITNATATSLEQFMNELGIKAALDPEVQEWIYGKIIAKKYDISYISGQIDIAKEDFMLDKLRGEAFAYDLNITFNQQLPSATASETHIKLDNGNLFFEFKDPEYQGKSLVGSEVEVLNLLETGTEVAVHIVGNSMLDKTILDVLNSYKINIPIVQKSGKLSSNLNLNIKIEPYDLSTNGEFELNDANIEISGAKFYSKSATIELDGANLNIKNANLEMKNLFSANQINGRVDTNKMNAKFDANLAKVSINAGDAKLFNRINFKSNIELDFSKKDTTLNLANLNTLITFGAKNNNIQISDITPILPYSALLKELGVTTGSANINTPNFTKFDIDAKNISIKTPFRKKDGAMYTNDDITIKVDKNIVSGATKNELLSFKIDGKGIISANIKNLDFILASDDSNESKDMPNLNFSAQNSALVLQDLNKTIEFNSYSGNLNKKNVKFFGKTGVNGNVTLNLAPNLMSLSAQNISGKEVNSILGMQSFDGGNFALKAVGKSPTAYRGEILIKDAFLKDYVLYQRLLSFINSVPALLTFKTPDFNDKGFSVKDGKVYFTRKGDEIFIQAMDFKGTSADIGGKGTINLKSGALNIDIEIKYLKDASSIIDYIPIVNQIILGSDRSISTVIKIQGTMKEPTYKSHVLTDVLLSPFNIIKNTLELPFVIFE